MSLAQSVYRIPIQVSDSLEVILVAKHPTSSLSLLQQASRWSSTTLRPMRYLQARWLSGIAEATGWSYHMVFRGAHALLAISIVALFTWVANPRRWLDVAALGFALTVLVGLHTFDAMMRESFPVNHFAEIAAATLFVLGTILRPARLLGETISIALLVGGLLLIESAVLIWVVILAGAVLHMPGARRRTAVTATVIVMLFMAVRSYLEITGPGIGAHSSGWGAVTLSGDELKAAFGDDPWPFFVYNVVGGAFSLIASEPRFGVYQLLATRESGSLSPVVIVNLLSSLLVTSAIVICCRAALRVSPRAWGNDQKALAMGTLVIGVSAALCANYIKDDIISTAGVMYAVMTYIAVRWLLDRVDTTSTMMRVVAVGLFLVISASLWAFRVAGTHYDLRRSAFVSRNDWALKDQRTLAGGEAASRDDISLVMRLRAEALAQRVTSPSFLPDWGERYWVE